VPVRGRYRNHPPVIRIVLPESSIYSVEPPVGDNNHFVRNVYYVGFKRGLHPLAVPGIKWSDWAAGATITNLARQS
jgi:hypothetical protein